MKIEKVDKIAKMQQKDQLIGNQQKSTWWSIIK